MTSSQLGKSSPGANRLAISQMGKSLPLGKGLAAILARRGFSFRTEKFAPQN